MRSPSTLRLREDVQLQVVYDDQTPYGSGLTGMCDALLQRSCAALRSVVARDGLDGLQTQADRWMPQIMAPRALGGLYADSEHLHEMCVYPPADRVRPVALDVLVPRTGGRDRTRIALREAVVTDLASWVGQWQRGAARPRAEHPAALWDRLDEIGALEILQAPRQPIADGITFIGHATVAMQEHGTQLIIDPFLLPPSAEDPPSLRPHTAVDLRPDAVFVTHSHPDHFDTSTLMRLGADVPVFVPAVERESLLSTDMARRLRELGFSRVTPLRWHDTARVGPFTVTALPFYGEQPSDGRILHPEARNRGNVYLVDGPGGRVALAADAGRDDAGDTTEMAAAARQRYGSIDILFGGYRAWRLQPIRYLFSSVARYLLFVPPEDRTRWHQIMNDADDLVATAHAWGARAIVPYANGGAPWFARARLGPQHDPERPDDPWIDPSLATVERSVRDAPTPIELLTLRTGQCVPMPRVPSPAIASH